MARLGVNNLLSIIFGASLIFSCSLISYIFQKRLFNKYKNKVKNTISKEDKPSP
jgi:hypothetical protein